MDRSTRSRTPQQRAGWLALGVAASVLAVGVPMSGAQLPPLLDTTTTTTPAPASTTTTIAPEPSSGAGLAAGADQAPDGAQDAGGDGAPVPAGGIRVPPDAQRIIDGVARTGASRNDELIAQLITLEDMGLSRAEAYRVGLGRFPIAGPARYSHDWLYPRYGPGFRFHLGTDVFAAYGTPVRAPVDGIARSANGGLGGLTVKVFMPDGTYFYLAHLSGLVEGFVDGMTVATGDIVGYVGDSGNARGGSPHLHIGIYPRGAAPVDPKPILDGFLTEAEARLPEVVAALQAAAPPSTTPTGDPEITVSEERRALVTDVLRSLTAGGAALPSELLYAAGANPLSGPRALVQVALDDLAASIDWSARAR